MKRIEWNNVTWYSKMIAVFVLFCVWMMGIYLGNQLLDTAASISVATAPLPPKTSGEPVIGQPCDLTKYVPNPAESEAKDTKGLQCQAYGASDILNTSTPPGIWVEPDYKDALGFAAENPPYGKKNPAYAGYITDYIKSTEFLTKKWATYKTEDGKLTFSYPANHWKIKSEKDASSSTDHYTITTEPLPDKADPSGYINPFYIEYFPLEKFSDSDEGKALLRENPQNEVAKPKNLESTEIFSINGKPALLTTRLSQGTYGNLGGAITTQRLFIINDDLYGISRPGYLKVTFYHTDSDHDYAADFVARAFLNSIRLR